MCQWELTALFALAAAQVLWKWPVSWNTNRQKHGQTAQKKRLSYVIFSLTKTSPV